VICGGLIKRVSPAMIHSYFDYIMTEYPRHAQHWMLLVQLHGPDCGMPWAPEGARKMLRRAGVRAGLGVIRPHAFRHSFATAVLDASDGNLVITRDAGGGRRPRWSTRSTPMSTSMTPPSISRCARLGVSTRD
jgi:integrase